MGFLTEQLVSFQGDLGIHGGAVQSLAKSPTETSWGSPLGFGTSDAAAHSPRIPQNHEYLHVFCYITKVNQCNINAKNH